MNAQQLCIGEKVETVLLSRESGAHGEYLGHVDDQGITAQVICEGITFEITRCVEVDGPFWTVKNLSTGKVATGNENNDLAYAAERAASDAEEDSEDGEEQTDFDHTATYSPEDDKIRIYLGYHLPRDEYAIISAAGFRNAPKQGCQFAVWSPEREDLALKLAGTIEPEGISLAERQAERAARLENLAYKNIAKANSFRNAADSISKRFEFGQPILIGHHSERSARRDQKRMHNAMRNASRCADAVDYWNYRAAGSERYANMKNSDTTRANRIKTLLAELRGVQRSINEAYAFMKRWELVEQLKAKDNFVETVTWLAGVGGASPRFNDSSAYDQLRKNAITAEEVVTASIEYQKMVVNYPKKYRWIEHLLNRLAYERCEQGKIDLYTGELTPVILQAFLREYGADSPECKKTETGFSAKSGVPFPIHILEEIGTSFELTDQEWREKMEGCGYVVPEKKQRRKSTSEKPSIPLINPTKEDAQKLQNLWFAQMVELLKDKPHYEAKTSELREMTQAVYSDGAKGEYAKYKTIELAADGKEVTMVWKAHQRVKSGVAVCRIRVSTANFEFHKPPSVIFITDKSAKSLPVEWEQNNG
jgi:hypothetical protein